MTKNSLLERLLDASSWPSDTPAPQVWLGEAVAIKDPTAVTLRRQSGANVMIVGQRDDAANAMLSAALIALAAQHPPRCAGFVILDGSPHDSPYTGELERVASALPHDTRTVEWRAVSEAVDELAAEMQRRLDGDVTDAPAIYILIYGLQRYRMLRRREDDFSFTTAPEDAAPRPDQQFADILRDGPFLGIHTMAWADTLATCERTLGRSGLGEFDNRVLFQMSAADSSNLIDSPLANKLGLYRALFYSEELGVQEKFRPYSHPTEEWLEKVRASLTRRR